MGQLTVNVPGTPKDEPIEVPPFGLIPNGSTVKLDDDQLDAYDQYMKYLAHDEEYEATEESDDVVIGDPEAVLPTAIPKPEVNNDLPVEAPPEPGPVSTPAEPESKDGE